jgi:hypothetical protein
MIEKSQQSIGGRLEEIEILVAWEKDWESGGGPRWPKSSKSKYVNGICGNTTAWFTDEAFRKCDARAFGS